MANDSDSDLEPELLGNIALLQREIDEDSNDEDVQEQEKALDKLIQLNDDISIKFQNIKHMFQDMLAATQKELQELREEINRLRASSSSSSKFIATKFGIPYFRDSSGRTPPPNMDASLQAKLGMMNCFLLHPGNAWMKKDKDNLQKELLRISRLEKIEILEYKLSELRNKSMSKLSRNECKQEILAQIEHINKAPLGEVAKSIEQEYEWEDIAFKFDYRHTASEISAMWKLHLHPSFRQGNLSRVEHCLLQTLANQHKFQDWDKISHELGGRRSAYQCFVLYRTAIADNNKGLKWTPEEDEFLRQNVECYRMGTIIPWATISTCFPNKSKIQIYNRYMRCIKPDLRKGRFVREEDEVLMAAVDQFGPNYKKIIQYLPGRDITQVRQRYTMSIRRKPSVWSVEEDRKLLHYISSMQLDSINFSVVAKHFENKDRSSVRTRYITLQRWMRLNPNADIRSAPRRGPKCLSYHCLEKLDLRTAVDRLVRRLEEESDVRIRINHVKDIEVDEAIVSVYMRLINEMNREEPNVNNTPSDTSHAAQDKKSEEQLAEDVYCLRILLLLLKANINNHLFMSSSLGAKYARLREKDPDGAPVIRIKTYTRKSTPDEIILDSDSKDAVSIWDDTKTYIPTYILPANYQILCGCKSLLQEAHHSTGLRRPISLTRASLLKTHYGKFLERCEILFTWALFLSNSPPMDMMASIHDNTVERIVPEIGTEPDIELDSRRSSDQCTFEPKFTHIVKRKTCFKEVNEIIDCPITSEAEMRNSANMPIDIQGLNDPVIRDEEDPLFLTYGQNEIQNYGSNSESDDNTDLTAQQRSPPSDQRNKIIDLTKCKRKINSKEAKENDAESPPRKLTQRGRGRRKK